MAPALLAVAVATLVGHLPAQDPDEPDADPVALMARLRAAPPAERRPILADLLALGERGAQPLWPFLEAETKRLTGRIEREREAQLRLFEQTAAALARRKFGPKTLAEIESLRDRARAITHDPALTEQRIHAELDPIHERLRQLVTVTPADVRAAEPKLVAQAAALEALLVEVAELGPTREHCALILRRKPAALPDVVAIRRDLAAAHERLAFAAMPVGERDRQVLAANQLAFEPPLTAEELAGIRELNDIRLRLGLCALRVDPALAAAARDHSKDMRELDFFAHDSPVPGKETPWLRAQRYKTSCSAENIARGDPTGVSAVHGWWYSPGHHKNMLGDHARVGLGRSGDFWTQMFGR